MNNLQRSPFVIFFSQQDHVTWKPPTTPRPITPCTRTSGSKVIQLRDFSTPTTHSTREIQPLKWMERIRADISAKHNTLIQVMPLILFNYGHKQNVIDGTKGFIRSIVLLILNRAFERLLIVLIPFRLLWWVIE